MATGFNTWVTPSSRMPNTTLADVGVQMKLTQTIDTVNRTVTVRIDGEYDYYRTSGYWDVPNGQIFEYSDPNAGESCYIYAGFDQATGGGETSHYAYGIKAAYAFRANAGNWYTQHAGQLLDMDSNRSTKINYSKTFSYNDNGDPISGTAYVKATRYWPGSGYVGAGTYTSNATISFTTDRIAAKRSTTINGVAKIQYKKSTTINGIAKINVVRSATINGLACVQNIMDTTISGLGDVLNVYTATISGRANIKQLAGVTTIDGISRVQTVASDYIYGQANIIKRQNSTISGLSRIESLEQATISGLAKIKVTIPEKLPEDWYVENDKEPEEWGDIDKDSTNWSCQDKEQENWSYREEESR